MVQGGTNMIMYTAIWNRKSFSLWTLERCLIPFPHKQAIWCLLYLRANIYNIMMLYKVSWNVGNRSFNAWRQPISYPHMWIMMCLLWIFWRKLSGWYQFATSASSCLESTSFQLWRHGVSWSRHDRLLAIVCEVLTLRLYITRTIVVELSWQRTGNKIELTPDDSIT